MIKLLDTGPSVPQPTDDKENEIKEHCVKVMGGATNPVMCEVNFDLRTAVLVKEYIINTHTP